MKSKSRDKDSTVSTATLKAELAKFLRLVEAGNEVTVLHHKTPIAKIVPFSDGPSPLETVKAVGEFSEVAKMKIPKARKAPKSDSLSLLLEERGSR